MKIPEPKTIVVDFDDTIAVPDYPHVKELKPGAKEALQAFRDMGFTILISSCRACAWNWESYYGNEPINHASERLAFIQMKRFLDENEVPYDILDDGTKGKPSGAFYIDDKAVRFEDNWAEIVRFIAEREEGYCQHCGVFKKYWHVSKCFTGFQHSDFSGKE